MQELMIFSSQAWKMFCNSMAEDAGFSSYDLISSREGTAYFRKLCSNSQLVDFTP